MEINGIILAIYFNVAAGTGVKAIVKLQTEEQYPQTIDIDFFNKDQMLQNYKQGDRVSIGINLKGRDWQNPQTGETKNFISVSGWKINYQQQQQPQQQYTQQYAPQQQYAQLPPQQLPQQQPQQLPQQQPQQYAQQPQQYAQPQQQQPQQQMQYPQNNWTADDDLPF